jgi:hypothetical protein
MSNEYNRLKEREPLYPLVHSAANHIQLVCPWYSRWFYPLMNACLVRAVEGE